MENSNKVYVKRDKVADKMDRMERLFNHKARLNKAFIKDKMSLKEYRLNTNLIEDQMELI